jgi:hypothetical protein
MSLKTCCHKNKLTEIYFSSKNGAAGRAPYKRGENVTL